MKDIVLSKSEYEALLEEIHRLQARISELNALRDDLLYHVCPALRAEYEEKIASLEREILAAEMYLRENQRVLEILQAQLNRQKEASVEAAQKEAREEFREYEEELKRKAKEAEDFKKYWEKDTQWSEHDRKEKEEKKKYSGKGEGSDFDEGKESSGSASGGNSDSGSGSEGNSDSGNGGSDGPGFKDKSGGTGNSEGSDSSHEGKYSGDEYDQDDEEGSGSASGRQETPARKLKRLYRKIVKRLHPDVHPDSSAREKELLNLAQEAMKTGNLEMMERIWDEVSGMDAPEEMYGDNPEDIAKLRDLIQKLKQRMSVLEAEIRNIRSGYPYTMKSFLEDEEAVEARRHELQDKLKNLREANEQLVRFIQQIKQQMSQ